MTSTLDQSITAPSAAETLPTPKPAPAPLAGPEPHGHASFMHHMSSRARITVMGFEDREMPFLSVQEVPGMSTVLAFAGRQVTPEVVGLARSLLGAALDLLAECERRCPDDTHTTTA